jgi:hypothetical protein
MTGPIRSPGAVSLLPDNTVLGDFGAVTRLDLPEEVLDGRGRWTEERWQTRRRSPPPPHVPDLVQLLTPDGLLGKPIACAPKPRSALR